MATDKRARQRANRAEKQAEAQKEARRAKAFKRVRRVLIYGVIFALVIFLASQIWGSGGNDRALGLLAGP